MSTQEGGGAAKQVIVFPRGQLTPKDKERMTKAGILAVEADDPSKVVCIIPAAPMVRADDLLMSALDGLCVAGAGSSSERSSFVLALHKRLKANEADRARTTEGGK